MSKFNKSFFNCEWLDKTLNPDFASWIKPVANNRHQANCTICLKNFELSNMGRRAVTSHLTSVTHVKRSMSASGCYSIGSFLPNMKKLDVASTAAVAHSADATSTSGDTPSTSGDAPSTSGDAPSTSGDAPSTSAVSTVDSRQVVQRTAKVDTFMVRNSVTDSEIIWTLKIVMNHLSLRSCTNLNETFRLMFPDSSIVASFALSPAKAAYTIVHGLAPYFSEALVLALQECPFFVACFDEALNKVAQKGQMDIVIRFWDCSVKQVSTRYLTSVFLGHATAKNLEEKFKEALTALNLKKLVQISMDGPSVNWKFLSSFAASTRPDACDPVLFDLGSCGLHVVHGAFQTGHKAAGWTVNELLRSMYGLFKDSPARRADYTAVTGSVCFPKKFCQVRWLANAEVAARAIEILPHVRKYLDSAAKLPNNWTCHNISTACADPLAIAKLAFFSSVALMFEPYLRGYQTAAPMMPFLHDDLAELLRCLLRRFVKQPVLKNADTSSKLIKIDLANKDTLVSSKDVDIGVAAVKALASSKISDLSKMQFRNECIAFMRAAAEKIVERSPLKYTMVRSFTCLAPRNIVISRSTSERRMGDLLQKLFEGNQISSLVADRSKVQFSALCSRAETDLKDVFDSYTMHRDRLDNFYTKLLDGQENFVELWSVVKFVMILSHGNASVESGFSINGDMLVENMHEESLIAQRQVYDAVKCQGGLLAVKIDKRMQQYARGAHSRYQAAMQVFILKYL